MSYPTLAFRAHAVQRMAQRQISVADVRQALATGQIIVNYANDTPCPSRLVLGWSGARPIHIVAADNDTNQETIIIMVYQPNPLKRTPDFSRRLP